MWWKNMKLMVMLVLVIVFLLYLMIGMGCGLPGEFPQTFSRQWDFY
jgi:vesicle-associated membrane protein 7